MKFIKKQSKLIVVGGVPWGTAGVLLQGDNPNITVDVPKDGNPNPNETINEPDGRIGGTNERIDESQQSLHGTNENIDTDAMNEIDNLVLDSISDVALEDETQFFGLSDDETSNNGSENNMNDGQEDSDTFNNELRRLVPDVTEDEMLLWKAKLASIDKTLFDLTKELENCGGNVEHAIENLTHKNATDGSVQDEVNQMDSMTTVIEHCNAVGYIPPGTNDGFQESSTNFEQISYERDNSSPGVHNSTDESSSKPRNSAIDACSHLNESFQKEEVKYPVDKNNDIKDQHEVPKEWDPTVDPKAFGFPEVARPIACYFGQGKDVLAVGWDEDGRLVVKFDNKRTSEFPIEYKDGTYQFDIEFDNGSIIWQAKALSNEFQEGKSPEELNWIADHKNQDPITWKKFSADAEAQWFIACRTGDVDRVETILKNQAVDVNKPPVGQNTKEIFRIKQCVGTGWTPLLIACHYGHSAVVDQLLQQKEIDVYAKRYDETTQEEITPLTKASEQCHSGIIQLLADHMISKGVAVEDAEAMVLDGQTRRLKIALSKNDDRNISVQKVLSDPEVDVSKMNIDGSEILVHVAKGDENGEVDTKIIQMFQDHLVSRGIPFEIVEAQVAQGRLDVFKREIHRIAPDLTEEEVIVWKNKLENVNKTALDLFMEFDPLQDTLESAFEKLMNGGLHEAHVQTDTAQSSTGLAGDTKNSNDVHEGTISTTVLGNIPLSQNVESDVFSEASSSATILRALPSGRVWGKPETYHLDTATESSTGLSSIPFGVSSQFGGDSGSSRITYGDGLNDLFTACKNGEVGILKLLLEKPNHNIDINQAIDKDDGKRLGHGGTGLTPLFVASDNGHSVVVRYLLSLSQVEVNKGTDDGQTALMTACSRGHSAVVKQLFLHPQIEINKVNKNGWTALYLACRYGHSQVVEQLLSRKEIDINTADHEGTTPLMEACHYGHSAIVEQLLARPEIDVNTDNDYSKRGTKTYFGTALMRASRKGDSQIVSQLLLHPQIDANQVDVDGRSALVHAAEGNKGKINLKVIQILGLIHLISEGVPVEIVQGQIAEGFLRRGVSLKTVVTDLDNLDIDASKMLFHGKPLLVHLSSVVDQNGSMKSSTVRRSRRRRQEDDDDNINININILEFLHSFFIGKGVPAKDVEAQIAEGQKLSKFKTAVKNGNLQDLKECLSESQFDASTVMIDNRSALAHVARGDTYGMVKPEIIEVFRDHLISKGISLEVIDADIADGRSYRIEKLKCALEDGKKYHIQDILSDPQIDLNDVDLDVSTITIDGTPLLTHLVAEDCSHEVVQKLRDHVISKGVPVEVVDGQITIGQQNKLKKNLANHVPGALRWLNNPGVDASKMDIDGKPVLVHFVATGNRLGRDVEILQRLRDHLISKGVPVEVIEAQIAEGERLKGGR